MKIEELMNRAVRTCSPDDSLEHAAGTMWEGDIGCLVVTDPERRPIGIITDRDALMAAYTQGIALRDGIVRCAMSPEVCTVRPDTSLDELELLMQEKRIRRVPVVDQWGYLVGIIGLGDLAQYSQWTANHLMGVHALAKTLSAVTKPRSSACGTAAE